MSSVFAYNHMGRVEMRDDCVLCKKPIHRSGGDVESLIADMVSTGRRVYITRRGFACAECYPKRTIDRLAKGYAKGICSPTVPMASIRIPQPMLFKVYCGLCGNFLTWGGDRLDALQATCCMTVYRLRGINYARPGESVENTLVSVYSERIYNYPPMTRPYNSDA
jgi:hypothetical protein